MGSSFYDNDQLTQKDCALIIIAYAVMMHYLNLDSYIITSIKDRGLNWKLNYWVYFILFLYTLFKVFNLQVINEE